jgi:fatty acid desaturase
MIFMRSVDKRFGDFMGMLIVLALVGFAIVAVLVVAGWFIIPILLAISVPVFIAWFGYWLIRQIFESPETQRTKQNWLRATRGLKPKSKI